MKAVVRTLAAPIAALLASAVAVIARGSFHSSAAVADIRVYS